MIPAAFSSVIRMLTLQLRNWVMMLPALLLEHGE